MKIPVMLIEFSLLSIELFVNVGIELVCLLSGRFGSNKSLLARAVESQIDGIFWRSLRMVWLENTLENQHDSLVKCLITLMIFGHAPS